MASGSQMIQRVLCVDLYHLMRMYRYQSSLFPDRPQAALKEHWRIIDAIAEGDGELAELLMRRHIRAVRERVRDMHVSDQADDVADDIERESS